MELRVGGGCLVLEDCGDQTCYVDCMLMVIHPCCVLWSWVAFLLVLAFPTHISMIFGVWITLNIYSSLLLPSASDTPEHSSIVLGIFHLK